MLKLFKWIFVLALVIGLALTFWVAFGLWTGIYSVYSIPPSKENPEGLTLLINRDEREPVFNSPQYKSPPEKAGSSPGSGIGFSGLPRPKRPLEIRTVVKLPYIEWAYQKSLEPPEPQK